MVKVALWLGLVGALLLTVVNRGHSHDHGRPELNQWFQDLRSSGGSLCCNGLDARPLIVDDWETADGHYKVRILGQWVVVPDHAVINGPNRDGRALVWWGTNGVNIIIRCFLAGPGA